MALFVQSGLKYTKSLLPETLLRGVSSVQTMVSRRFLSVAPPRRFQVYTSSRRWSKSLEASSLEHLLQQVAVVLTSDPGSLVLEEDGTVVDSEEMFQALPGDTSLMVLEKGDQWSHSKESLSLNVAPRSGLIELTFDLHRPKDVLCCLTVSATILESHTLHCSICCTRASDLPRSLLRCVTCLSSFTGQLLLYTSSTLLHFTDHSD